MSKQYDASILPLFSIICTNSGIKHIPYEDEFFYNKYKTFANLYNQIRRISSRQNIHSPINITEIDETLKNMTSIDSAISFMNYTIYTKKAEEELGTLNLEYRQKIYQLVNLIKETNVDTNNIPLLINFAEQYERIIREPASKNEKNRKLKELIKKVDNFYQLYLRVIENVLTKIRGIENQIRTKGSLLALYKGIDTSKMKEDLFALFKNNSISEKSPSFIEFCKGIDEIDDKVHTLSTISIRPESSYLYSNLDSQTIKYDIHGIFLEINKETKECKIKIDNEQLSHALEHYKIEKLIRDLADKLLSTPIDEITKPTEVNEKQLSKYFKSGEIPLEYILKFDINDLLKNLGIYKALQQEITLVEFFNQLFKVEQKNLDESDKLSSKLIDLHTLLELLIAEGYSLKLNDIEIDSDDYIFNEILKIYQRISVQPIANKKIYTTISEVLLTRLQDNTLVYSSLQIVYNCIDRNLIKSMHEELNNQVAIGDAKNTNIVISILKKHARKQDGKSYSDDEILNFLKSKNEIVNTRDYPETIPSYYIEDDLKHIESVLSEYDENIGMNDVYEILYKITGRHR